MKIGIVNASLLASKGSLAASDFLCPNDALEKDIERLEKAQNTVNTSLRNKREELSRRQREEDLAVARGDLTIIER
jgi:phosphoenolpyruvate-protein kinase (PTS system EI component)